MDKKLSPLLIFLSGCLWGTLGIFVRRFNEYGIESMSIVFLRTLFTSAVLLIITLFCKPNALKVNFRDIWIFICLGVVSLVFFNFCYFTSVSLMSLSAAAVLLYTSPIFVMIFSAIFFKEKITGRKITAAVLCVTGLIFVTGIIGSDVKISGIGILFGIGSAVGYALYSIFSRAALNRGYSVLTITLYGFLSAAIFSAFAADLNACADMYKKTPFMAAYTLVFVIIASVLPYIFYSAGLKNTENGKAAVIASVEPIAATLYGIIAYHEIPSVFSWIGIILVLSAIFLIGTDGAEKNNK